LLISAAVVSVPVLGAAPASAAASVKVLYYDSGHAAEFAKAVNQAATNWNARVTNVRLQRWTNGKPRNIVVYADAGWPHASTGVLGNGSVYIGRQAVRQGHNPTRIAAHEIGHLLGLPDHRTGICSELMSGRSAGTSCTNALPNKMEAARVSRAFKLG
jgi:snapalysin